MQNKRKQSFFKIKSIIGPSDMSQHSANFKHVFIHFLNQCKIHLKRTLKIMKNRLTLNLTAYKQVDFKFHLWAG